MWSRSLGRREPVPPRARGDVYMFDQDIDPGDLARLRREAARMAEALGAPAPTRDESVPSDAMWVYADTSFSKFGEEVDEQLSSGDAKSRVQGSVGLVRWSDADDEWAFMEKVRREDIAEWKDMKYGGPGRDRRLGLTKRDAEGKRFCLLADAMTGFRPLDLAKEAGWPFAGPRASTEMLGAIRGTGRELGTYHDLFAAKCGAHPEASVLHEHKCWLSMLQLLVTVDQLDPTNVSAAEFACRRVLQIQRAIRQNPKAPSFVGLQSMLQHSHDDAGAIITRDFSRHVAEGAAMEANIMKQHRLLREEQSEKEKKGPRNKKRDGDDS